MKTPFAHSLNPELKSFTTGLNAERFLSGRRTTLYNISVGVQVTAVV